MKLFEGRALLRVVAIASKLLFLYSSLYVLYVQSRVPFFWCGFCTISARRVIIGQLVKAGKRVLKLTYKKRKISSASWRNGSAFDSRSKGYPFKSGWGHPNKLFFGDSNYKIVVQPLTRFSFILIY